MELSGDEEMMIELELSKFVIVVCSLLVVVGLLFVVV